MDEQRGRYKTGLAQRAKLFVKSLADKNEHPRINILFMLIQDLSLIAAMFGCFRIFCLLISIISLSIPVNDKLPKEIHSYLPFELLPCIITMLELVIIVVASSNIIMHTVKMFKFKEGGYNAYFTK